MAERNPALGPSAQGNPAPGNAAPQDRVSLSAGPGLHAPPSAAELHREPGPFTVRHVTQLVLRLPVGALIAVIVGAISLVGGLFGAGYRAATYFHDPAAIEQTLISQKDALQSQADRYRELSAERLHQVESLTASHKALSERFERFMLETGKTLATLKDETGATVQQIGAALRDRDQTIASLNQSLAARAQELQQAANGAREKEQALQQRDQALAAANQSLSARAQEAQRLTETVKEKDLALQQRDQTIAGLNQALAVRAQETQQLVAALREKEQALQQRDQTVTSLNQSLTARAQEIQKLAGTVRERDDAIRQRDQTLATLAAKIDAASAGK